MIIQIPVLKTTNVYKKLNSCFYLTYIYGILNELTDVIIAVIKQFFLIAILA